METIDVQAKKFAEVRVENMLAHTIREIEEEIFQESRSKEYGLNYRIQILVSEGTSVACCWFADRNCTIFLPKKTTEGDAPNKRDIKEMRIRLAHELGHVVANIPAIIECRLHATPDYSAEEEADAWDFAYRLLWHKSEFHKRNTYDDFKYRSRKDLVNEVKYFIRVCCGDDVKAELKKKKSELAE
jgi:hypothetical protein